MRLTSTSIDFQSYPRYDKDTITRKVRSVIGQERYAVGDGLSDEEWIEVFGLCEREYKMRGIPIVSARTMHRIEALSADRVSINASKLVRLARTTRQEKKR